MAKVLFQYIEDEDDGMLHQQLVTIQRDGVEVLSQLANFIGDAVRAAGYTYVEQVTFTTAEGRSFSNLL